MMIGIGTDIIEIGRIEKLYKKFGQKLVDRLLSEPEQAQFLQTHCSVAYLAKRFAAKEAVAKALGTGIGVVAFNEISVTNLENGQPVVELLGNAQKILKERNIQNIIISLADEKKYAIAFVLIN